MAITPAMRDITNPKLISVNGLADATLALMIQYERITPSSPRSWDLHSAAKDRVVQRISFTRRENRLAIDARVPG